ncbi:MAG: C25 family cysteine peptidase [Thermoplasmatota archaeon]
MKKILPIIITLVLFISGLGAVATPFNEYDISQTTLSFSTPIITDKTTHISIEIEEANCLFIRQNHYIVPKHVETYTFPFGTTIHEIHCTPKNIQSYQLTKELEIAPEPVLLHQASFKSDTVKTTPLSLQKWYEYDIGSGMINRNERGIIVKIETYPVQYIPTSNMIQWAESIKIDITYSTPFHQPTFFENEYSLIILALNEFTSQINPLVQHKINRGITTKFVSLEQIYDGTYFPVQGRDNPEKIKYFIKDAIENWGTSNVLLVGGSAKFPTRTVHVNAGQGDTELFVSDLYYADIYDEFGGFSCWDSNNNNVFGEFDWNGNTDIIDLHPDVFLSRLACTNANQVTIAVNKIITYENNDAYTQSWFGNLVVLGGDTFPGDDHQIDEGEYANQACIDIMDGFVPTKLWASQGDLSGYLPSGAQKISSALNQGAGFVHFSGHGNPSVWATHPHEQQNVWLPTPYGAYYNSNVEDLSNVNQLPIVLIGACSVSKYNQNQDCFGWSFIKNSNGGGIGVMGSSALAWGYIGSHVTQGLIEGMVLNTFRAYRLDGAISFGEMWARAITDYIFSGMQGFDYKTIKAWQPFGDPTLAIGAESLSPLTPTDLSGPTNGKINQEHTYSASTTDPEGDKIYYLFDWGDGEFSGWVGPYNSGQTAQANHIWTEEGNYEIRVKAKDERGSQSEWSDPLPVTMPLTHNYRFSVFTQILHMLIQQFPLLRQILSLMHSLTI